MFWMKDERGLRGNRNYRLLDTNKSGVRFHSTALAELNTQYVEARSEYEEHQKAVVSEIIKIAGMIIPNLFPPF